MHSKKALQAHTGGPRIPGETMTIEDFAAKNNNAKKSNSVMIKLFPMFPMTLIL